MANSEHIAILHQGIKHWNEHRRLNDFIPDFAYHDFKGAYLKDVDFRGANLLGADFRNANLRNAQLTGAVVDGADFTNASINDAKFDKPTFNFSDDRKVEVERTAIRHRASVAQLFGLPDRNVTVLRTKFDGTNLKSLLSTKKKKTEFNRIFEHAEKLAREIVGSGKYSNFAPEIHSACVQYLNAVQQYHDGEGEIPLGLAGRYVLDVFDAKEKMLQKEFPDDLGMIKNFAFSHQLLERFLDEWKELVNSAEITPDDIIDIEDLVNDSDDFASVLQKDHRIDKHIPRTIRYLNEFLRDPTESAKQMGYALIRGIEDIFIELFSIIVDAYSEAKDLVTKGGGVLAAAALVGAIYASSSGLQNIVVGNESLLKWIERGVSWLREIGVLK